MIVLDEDGVEQAVAMVAATAAADGIFLEGAQAWRCLSRVENVRPGARDLYPTYLRVSVAMPAHVAEEVERHALARKQRACVAGYASYDRVLRRRCRRREPVA